MVVLDKNIIQTDLNGNCNTESEIFLKEHLKSIGRVLSPFGYCPETNQLSFKITAFKDNPACSKVSPLLSSIIDILEPVQVHPDLKTKFKAIAIVDKQRGYSGRYTLLVNDKNQYAILKERAEESSMLVNFGVLKDLDQALIYISKKLPYHGT